MPARLWPATGLAFVACFVAWVLLLGAVELGGGQPRPSNAEVVQLLSDTPRQGAAHLLAGLAAVSLLAFSAYVFAGSTAAERPAVLLGATAALSGGALALVILVTTGLVTGAADIFRRGASIDPASAQIVFDLAGGMHAFVPYLAASFALTTSLLGTSSWGVSRWLRRAGVVFAVALLAGALSYDVVPGDPLWFIGIAAMLLWLVWVAVLSAVLVARSQTPADARSAR
jgi:hypothetical protein